MLDNGWSCWVVGNTSLLTCRHWPNIGPKLKFQQWTYCCWPNVGTTTTHQRWIFSWGATTRKVESSFSNESIILVASTLVGPALSQRDTWKRMVGITLAYAGLVEPDGQNDLGPTLFVNVGPTKLQTKCQRWSNKWLLSRINSSHSWKWIHEQYLKSWINLSSFSRKGIFF